MTYKGGRGFVTASYPTLFDPTDCSPPGSSVHGTSQGSILEWVAASFSTGFSQPRGQSCVSCIGRQILCHWATREAPWTTVAVCNQVFSMNWARNSLRKDGGSQGSLTGVGASELNSGKCLEVGLVAGVEVGEEVPSALGKCQDPPFPALSIQVEKDRVSSQSESWVWGSLLPRVCKGDSWMPSEGARLC